MELISIVTTILAIGFLLLVLVVCLSFVLSKTRIEPERTEKSKFAKVYIQPYYQNKQSIDYSFHRIDSFSFKQSQPRSLNVITKPTTPALTYTRAKEDDHRRKSFSKPTNGTIVNEEMNNKSKLHVINFY